MTGVVIVTKIMWLCYGINHIYICMYAVLCVLNSASSEVYIKLLHRVAD